MASIRVSKRAAAAAVAAAAAFSTLSSTAHADGSFMFSPFSRSQTPAPPPPQQSGVVDGGDSKPSDEESGGRSSGFDPESLERAAKALRDINSSPYAKVVFDIMRKQEQTRLTELEADKFKFEAMQSQIDIERKQKMAEEQRNLYQQQAQAKAQGLRYEDELARKRMQADHEAQRKHNAELVRMQEQSSLRQEQARRATEEQIQAQIRETEKERAKNVQESFKHDALAKAEADALQKKLSEETDRKLLKEKMNGDKEKWLAAINATFGHIEVGLKELLTDRSKLIMAVGGATALAAGVYTSREGARVTWGYINRILGQPSLIRESSMSRFPWSGLVSKVKGTSFTYSTGTATPGTSGVKSAFENVVLHPSLQRRIEQLARATANTKAHQAPFRNMLFYGPPGTGKTLVAREIARKSGLDYAMMTGGDVAPLGPQGVTKIHEIFDWARKSKKGLLLFIDEADAFLCQRNSTQMSEAQRSALNALLFRTGDQSRDIVLVLATNRPGDLDNAVTDRIDEVLEFPLPGEAERYKLLNLYLNKYLREDTNGDRKWGFSLKKRPQKITIRDLSDDVIREAARKTEGFSGREIAKLMASVQAAVYGRPDCVLDSEIFKEVVGYKVSEHHQRLKLASEGGSEAKKLRV